VAQALERNPRADPATYSVDWTGLFEAGEPRQCKAFADSVVAIERIAADLAIARRRLRGAGIYDFEVDGPMRLPLWFARATGPCLGPDSPTWTYWDMGEPGQYAAALRVLNWQARQPIWTYALMCPLSEFEETAAAVGTADRAGLWTPGRGI
jgi:hypothetical protein